MFLYHEAPLRLRMYHEAPLRLRMYHEALLRLRMYHEAPLRLAHEAELRGTKKTETTKKGRLGSINISQCEEKNPLHLD
jgi:hypothetical protein